MTNTWPTLNNGVRPAHVSAALMYLVSAGVWCRVLGAYSYVCSDFNTSVGRKLSRRQCAFGPLLRLRFWFAICCRSFRRFRIFSFGGMQMLSKLVSLTLAFSLGGIAGAQITYARSQTEAQARADAKVKQRIQKRGVGESARVEVVMQDGAKLKGYISEAGEESFVIVAANGGAPTRLSYSEVKQVKGRGRSKGSKFLIGLGIAGGVYLFLGILMDWE